MTTRRQFILSAVATACAPLGAASSCSSGERAVNYDDAARSTWRHASGDVTETAALLRELVRYATLAPSSHNTQCWRFRLEERAISILPDLSRRCPAVDPDDHHLFVSLGSAAENLIQAALANGLKGEPRFEPAPNDTLRVALDSTRAVVSPLFRAIPERQCTRAEFDGQPLSGTDLNLLERAGTENGVRVTLLTERAMMERVLEYVIQGNTAQINEPAFIEELKAWIRFSDDEAVRTRDGLFTRATGNPSVPRWLGSRMFNLFFTPKSENDKYAKQIRSSAGIAVFTSEANDKAHWVQAGRCYERFALQATALGVRNAFLNQPVEVSALRPQFANFLGIGANRPDLVVRFGRGATMPRSLRRPVQAVLT